MPDIDISELVGDFDQIYQEASEEVYNRFQKDRKEYGY